MNMRYKGYIWWAWLLSVSFHSFVFSFWWCAPPKGAVPHTICSLLMKVSLSAKASPFGRGGTEGDGEGKDADREQPTRRWHRSDEETAYRCTAALSHRPCPLRRFAPAPPKGEPFHQVNITTKG